MPSPSLSLRQHCSLSILFVATACAGAEGDDPWPEPENFDCSAVPDTLSTETIIEGARAHKGLAFDSDGTLVGSDNSALIRTSRAGDWSVFVPGIGEIEQLVFLPDGDLVVTSSWGDGSMRRITPNGGISTMVSDLFAYSVTLGPDGMLYAAGWNGLYRIEPETGSVKTLLSTGWNDPWSARTLAFSRSGKRLYIGTVDDRGRIFYFDLDEELEPVGEPQLFVAGVGNGWHDGLGMDLCRNLWAVDFESSALYRISEDGEVRTMMDWSSDREQFGHGLVWGPDNDGWRSDALYLPVPEAGSSVKEVIIGVPAADLPELL